MNIKYKYQRYHVFALIVYLSLLVGSCGEQKAELGQTDDPSAFEPGKVLLVRLAYQP